jgi:hypothetical protein
MPRGPKLAVGRAGSGDGLIATLRERFAAQPERHPKIEWTAVEARLTPPVLATLTAMEGSGGEPDVALIGQSNELIFVDCAAESPLGRRSLCFDREAWQSRKEARPTSNVIDVADTMGVELLDEPEYRALQSLGQFDTKTSSWIQTPPAIRVLGGALFCDRRYDHVFTYHNGAQSYYAARGFRAKLRI